MITAIKRRCQHRGGSGLKPEACTKPVLMPSAPSYHSSRWLCVLTIHRGTRTAGGKITVFARKMLVQRER